MNYLQTLTLDTYLVMHDFNFKQYMAKKQDDYHNGNLGPNFTHKNLMAQATAKFTYITTRKIWGSKSPNKEHLIAMIADLKGKLKITPALSDKRKKDGSNKKDKDVKVGNIKTKNEKNTSNKKAQKLDEAWKRIAFKERQAHQEGHRWQDLPVVRPPHGLGGPLCPGVPSWGIL